MRASNCPPPVANAACSNGPSKQKPDTFNGPIAFSPAVASSSQTSTVHSELGKKLFLTEEGQNIQAKGKMDKVESMKQHMGMDPLTTASDYPISAYGDPSSAGLPVPEDNDEDICMPPEIISPVDVIRQMCAPGVGKDRGVSVNGNTQSLCSELSSMSIDRNLRDEQSGVAKPYERTLQYYTEPVGELSASATAIRAATVSNEECVPSEQRDWRLNSRSQVVANAFSEAEDDLQSFNDQRLKDPEVVIHSSYMPKSDDSLHLSNHPREHSLRYTESFREANFNADPLFGHRNAHEGSLPHSFSTSVVSNGYAENLVSSSTSLDRAVERSYLPPDEGKGRQMGGFQRNVTNVDNDAASLDMGESSIISNILSMDFDAWDDPLTSPQNLAKLFGETDKQHGSLKLSSSWKVQNSNQSRFSFARQEDSKNQEFNTDLPFNVGRVPKNHSFSQDFVENRVPYTDKLGNGNSFSFSDMEEYNNISGSQYVIPSSKLSGKGWLKSLALLFFLVPL